MKTPEKELVSAALQLPPEARAALAAELIESLDRGTVDPDVETLWADEIRHRVAEVDSGVVAAIPWSIARRRIMAAAGGDADQG